jgi:hypothetical protein
VAGLLHDLRFAARMLRKNPGFRAAAVLSLTLGIGASTTAFTMMTALLLRPLPVEEPERLVSLVPRLPGSMPGGFSYPELQEYRDLEGVFEGVAGHTGGKLSLSEGDRAELVWGDIVTADYFDVLGARPALGRLFRPGEDDVEGGSASVVIGYGLWQRRFAGARDVLGRSIRLNGRPFTVVGVAPRRF